MGQSTVFLAFGAYLAFGILIICIFCRPKIKLRLSAVEQNFLNQCSEMGFDSALIFGKKFDF